MDAFATNVAKKYPEEDVIFAIHQNIPWARSLLQLDLETKYEGMKLQNITVKTFKTISDLKRINLTNATLCIDEITMRDVTLEELIGINAKSIWIVIRETPKRVQNSEAYIRNEFSDWVIVNLSYPLRTSKTLSEKVKNEYIISGPHKNKFNESLQIPPNMPVGPKPLILSKLAGSYHKRLKHAFNVAVKDKHALIIIVPFSMQPKVEEIKEAKKTSSHERLAEKCDR